MARQGQCKIWREVIVHEQRKQHAFWWTPEFVSAEMFKVKKYLIKQGKCLKFFKLTAKPKVLEKLKRSWKKSWNLKSSKAYKPCFYGMCFFI